MPKLTKSDLLKVKTEEQLAHKLFPPSEGYQYRKERGVNGEIIIVIDELGTEAHVLTAKDRPQKTDYVRDGAWSANVDFKFVFQPGKHLLLLGKDLNSLGKPRYRHVRVEWNDEGVTKSFVQILNKLEFGQYAAFLDLFDRKEVTNRFYEEFIQEIELLTAGVRNVPTIPEARRFAFTVAERLLFLHFIQTKSILDRNPSYVNELVKRTKSDIYVKALKPLFFDCLNREGPLRKLGFGEIPYLNGGLFRPGDIEEHAPKAVFTDDAMRRFIDFLGGGRWNWHLDERADVDQPNTLDPALLGHIFEKTVNQKDTGAYYTPRPIARYMAEQGLYGYLGSRLTPPADPGDLRARLEAMNPEELIAFARDHLRNITILDNACGSGAFLLAGLDVLLDTWEYIFDKAGIGHYADLGALFELTDVKVNRKYQLTKWLIGRNLYGTDIEPGAIEIAKLRLWLALITHAPDSPTAIKPLPNIDYNLRAGNALVGFTQWPGKMSSLSSLEKDCSDLAKQIPGDKDDALAKRWAQGAPLVPALRSRQALVGRFRFITNSKEAGQLKKVIDTFDARVRPQIEGLWEAELAKKIEDPEWLNKYRELRADSIRPFHWWYEFPTMMEEGGASVIITNPPWEVVEAEIRRFHTTWIPDLMNEERYPNAYATCEELWKSQPDAKAAWERYDTYYDLMGTFFSKSGRWQNQGRGRPNFYKLFLEVYPGLLRPGGRLLAVVQGGIYHDGGCSLLRKLYWESMHWHEMLGFVNTWPIFDGVHPQQKIAVMNASASAPAESVDCFFMAVEPDSPENRPRLTIKRSQIQALYPETETFPAIRSQEELDVLLKTTKFPPFGGQDWGIQWVWEVHRKKETLHLFSEKPTAFPFIEGESFNQFDAEFAQPTLYLKERDLRVHFDEKFGAEARAQLNGTRLVFRETSNNENITRTLISAVVKGPCGISHTAWAERVGTLADDRRPLLLCILNSLMADYMTRRLANRHVTKEILESLRLPTPAAIEPFGRELTALAKKLVDSRGAYDRDRAKLDAIVSAVYGLTVPEIVLVWNSFRVLKERQPGYIDLVVDEFERLRSQDWSRRQGRTR